MIDDDAWPSAQAFTSWAKSVTVSPSILRSTVTVEPHSLDRAVALASGLRQAAQPRNMAGQLQNTAIVDVVEHGPPYPRPLRGLIVFGLEFDYIWRSRAAGKVFRAALVTWLRPCRRSHANWECGVRLPRAKHHVRRMNRRKTRPPGDTPGSRLECRGAGRTERPMDAIVKPWPKGSNPPLSDHVRNAPQPVDAAADARARPRRPCAR